MDVLEVVQNISDWKRLGLTLGLLLKPTLTDIETHRHYKPEDCKIDMLSAWLEQQDNVSQRGVPSLSVLRAAVCVDKSVLARIVMLTCFSPEHYRE